MNSRTKNLSLLIALLLSALVLTLSNTAGISLKTLPGHVPRAAQLLQPFGQLPTTDRLHLAIGLPVRDPVGLARFIEQLYDPASPLYRQYLTPTQFTEMFGPSVAEYETVKRFAGQNNLTITATHPNRMVLEVNGTVGDIEKAFHINLRTYQHPTESRTFYAPDVEPTVDVTLPILNISGLDNYSLPHPNFHRRPVNVAGDATPSLGSGPGGSYRGNDFRAAYIPGVSLTGTGQSIGLLEFDGYYSNDIATYESQAGLPSVPLTNVAVNGGISFPGNDNVEVALDIEMAVAMAPGLSQIYVYEAPNLGSNWVALLNRMATDNLSKQLSCSWFGGTNPNATADQIFQQMAAQGQTFFNASGDSDAYIGNIPFPCDNPYIVEVGGTTLSTTGPSGSWTAETVWNWGFVNGAYTGSSGGISTYYPIPTWQQGISTIASQGSATNRNVPDVALTADNIYVVYNNGATGNFGGTSCAAPLWAAFTALVNQQAAASANQPVGFLNPALYTMGQGSNYASDFRDITTGDNTWPRSPSQFSAVPGYDLCTGWGTPKAALISALAGTVTPTPTPAPTPTPTPTPSPGINLAPYQPPGWSDKIVASNVTGTNTDTVLRPTDRIYVDWAEINNGTVATTTSFYTALYVDGGLKTYWTTSSPLSPSPAYASVTDYSIGSLSAG